jgi:hypothetical protein
MSHLSTWNKTFIKSLSSRPRLLVIRNNRQSLSCLRVDTIMLNNESNIVEDDHDSEKKFDDIDLDILTEDGL